MIQIDKFGGPEVLKCLKMSIPKLKANQVLIKLKAIGVNYIDTYQRTGLYNKYPLEDAVQAHRDLETRKTSGNLLLIP